MDHSSRRTDKEASIITGKNEQSVFKKRRDAETTNEEKSHNDAQMGNYKTSESLERRRTR